MAALKAHEVDRFLSKPEFSKPVFLIYGPDLGLVSERADMLAAKSGVDLKDDFSLIRLDADVAASDPARIASEAHTIGMFGGKRLIRISGITRRDLAKALKPVLETPPDDAVIIVEAGDLKKSAGLRKLVENDPLGLCLPCYQDDDKALEELVRQEITDRGLKIERETVAALKNMLGSDRKVSRGELAKLALYCEGKETVSLDDVNEIIGDASALVINDLIDASATGDLKTMQEILPKAYEAGNSPDIIMLYLLQHFQMLQMARSGVEQNRQPASSVIGSMRPPVHFARKGAITTALNLWPLERLSRALTRIDKAMLECRANNTIARSIAGTTCLALAAEAKTLKNRR